VEELGVIAEILRKLGEGVTPSAVQASHLAGLSSAEFAEAQFAWAGLPPERRRAIVALAVQLAENDVQLDFSTFFKWCLKDSDAAVRAKAVEGLWEDEEFRTADILATLVRNDSDEAVRIAAALALARFAVMAEVGTLYAPTAGRVRHALVESVQDPDETLEVRRRSLEALGALSGDAVVDLIENGYRDPSDKMRASAVYAMGRNADDHWLPTILRELESENAEMRFEAARAAGALENQRAVVPLITVLDDDDGEVRLAAIGALGEIGGDVARKALEQCARAKDPAIREAAADALSALDLAGDPLSIRPFTNDSTPTV
jgi:HEAT repeat protein